MISRNGKQDAGMKLEIIEEECIEMKLEEGIIEGVDCEVLKWSVEEKDEEKVGCGDAGVKRGGSGIGMVEQEDGVCEGV